MSNVIIRLNERDAREILGELATEFDKLGKNLPKIIARVQNVVIRGMRTEVVRAIRAEYAAPAKDVAKTMSIRLAGKLRPYASLHMRGRMAVELVRYGAVARKKGVAVKVLKSSKKAPIKSGGKTGILSTIKRGASATWIAKNHVLARTSSKDHPIMLWGPSFITVLNREEVKNSLQETAGLRFEKDLLKQVNYELSKAAKK